MSKSTKLRTEEYLPTGSFLEVSFSRDRAEFEKDFSEFTPEYLVGFKNQMQTVASLEDSLLLTEQQKGVTKNLYAATDLMNKELNILSFHFKRAKLDTKIISKAKKDLTTGNVEGANLKVKAIIQMAESKAEALQSKGMKVDYSTQLEVKNADLLAKNVLQNELMDMRGQLTENNSAVYKALYKYISTIAEAGKIIYDGKGKRDEYVISKLVSRMRVADRVDLEESDLTN